MSEELEAPEGDAPENTEAESEEVSEPTFDWRDPKAWTDVEGWKARFAATSPVTRLIAVSVVGFVAAAAWLLSTGSALQFDTLYGGLSDDDRARIVERLGRQSIPFELEEGNLRVPQERVHEIRLMLASEGLPRGGASGFELFDQQRFGESEFTEQIQYHRALEGELSRTISHLAGVDRARVHLVLPERSLFVERDGQASASVVLHLAAGWRVSEQQAAGIVHLIASSVRGLNAEDVTLVDGEGRPVQDEEGGDDIGDALAYRQRLERDRARSLQRLLDETLGEGVARVEVSAEINLRRDERTEERYHPDEVAARSFQIEEERNGQDDGAEGVPGAASNLPGGAPNEEGSDAGLRRRSETRNFEVSKTVRQTVEPIGTLARQSIAVVVDGTWEGETFTARSEEELAGIESIAKAAAGYNEERGDTLTVTCVPFYRDDVVEAIDPLAPVRPYMAFIPYVVGLLVLIFGPLTIWFVRRRRRKREEAEAAAEAEAAETAEKALGAGDEQKVDARELSADSVRAMLLESGKEEEAEVAGEVQTVAAELAAEDPVRAARVLRGWLLEDGAFGEDDEEEEEGADKEEAAA